MEVIPQAGVLPDPTVSLGYFVLPVETRLGAQRLKIGIRQSFPWLGTLAAQKEIASYKGIMRFNEWEALGNRLFYEVKSTWFELLKLSKDEAAIQESIEIFRSYEQLSLQNIKIT